MSPTFSITDLCPYTLATDSCLPGERRANYEVVVNHENRYNNTAAIFIKSVDAYIRGVIYTIDANLSVNRQRVSLPYTSQDNSCRAYKQLRYTVLECQLFKVEFDGVQFLKFQECGKNVCGLCGNKLNAYPINPRQWSQCVGIAA